MSRTYARALLGLLEAATAALSPRQRAKTLSRVAGAIEQRGATALATRHGELRLLALRGPHVASAVANFASDEPETLAWIDEAIRPGETLWDVGANIGLYALYAALRGIDVVAFEPKAMTFGLLVEHIALNRLGDRIVPLCLALSDTTGLTRLRLSSVVAGGAGNALAGEPSQFGSSEAVFSQAVPAFSADDLCRLPGVAPPRHIKLDVDGIEPLILRGAAQTLASVQSVLVEVEGANLAEASARIELPLRAAGLTEDLGFRERGSRRNRCYRR